MLPTTFWTWLITSCPSGGELSVAIGSCADFPYVLGAHGFGACCGCFGVRIFYAEIHKKKLSKYNHPTPKQPQHAPYPCAPKTYRKLAQDPITTDNSPPAGQEGITHVQKVIAVSDGKDRKSVTN